MAALCGSRFVDIEVRRAVFLDFLRRCRLTLWRRHGNWTCPLQLCWQGHLFRHDPLLLQLLLLHYMGIDVFQVSVQHLAVCLDDSSIDVWVPVGNWRPRRLQARREDVRSLGILLWRWPGEVPRAAWRRESGRERMGCWLRGFESRLYHLNIKGFGRDLDLVSELATQADESDADNADGEEVCSNDAANLCWEE